MIDKKLHISNEVYKHNLDFYTIIKLLLQCKFADKQLIDFQSRVSKQTSTAGLTNTFSNFAVGNNQDKLTALNYLVGLADRTPPLKIAAFIDCAVELLLLKDLVLQEAKVYVSNEYRKEVNEIHDYLSIATDIATLHMPYGQRVVGALMLFALTSEKRRNSYLLRSTVQATKTLSKKIARLAKEYYLNTNSVFQIILDESMNQSIKSTAGASYETRVKEALAPIVDNLAGHSHDKNYQAVEYDFTFFYNNKKCGVSAKRTLRERYKQNHDDTNNLEVDYMFAITLGLDLNEDKLNAILHKHGNYVIVSSEQYNQKKYLSQNPKVIPSDRIKECFDEIIK
jgi:hypothetical protein